MSKSAFPYQPSKVWNEATFQHETVEISPGMTLAEWQWTQFAAAALPVLLDKAMASGKEKEVLSVVEATCSTADAMMAAIAEREQGGRDD